MGCRAKLKILEIPNTKTIVQCNVSSCNEAESDNEYNENEHPSGHATDASKKSQTLTAADTDSSDAGIFSIILTKNAVKY